MDDELPGILGNWQLAFTPAAAPASQESQVPISASAPQGMAFGLAAASPPGVPVWRFDLPADQQAAATRLDQAERQLQASQAILESTPQRAAALVGRLQAESRAEVSFRAAYQPLAQPEAELAGMLSTLRPAPLPASFSLEQPAAGAWDEARDRFRQDTARLLRLVSQLAWVETYLQGRLLARTALGWTGGLETLWGQGARQDQASLHARSLALALASRNTLVRMLFLTVRSAAKISALLAVPGGALLALPAAWKFVRQTLDEIEKIQELSTQTGGT